MNSYPIELDLAGRDVLVVGGGPVAAHKVAGLVESGARVRVICPDCVPELEQRVDLHLERRAYSTEDIGPARLVFACTDDSTINARVAADARRAGAWCCVADDPDAGDFHLPAVLRRGALTVTVGTGGASPLLAAALRDRLESHFSPEMGILVAELRRARQIVHQKVDDPQARRRILATLCADCSIELLTRRGQDAWRAWFERILSYRLAGRRRA